MNTVNQNIHVGLYATDITRLSFWCWLYSHQSFSTVERLCLDEWTLWYSISHSMLIQFYEVSPEREGGQSILYSQWCGAGLTSRFDFSKPLLHYIVKLKGKGEAYSGTELFFSEGVLIQLEFLLESTILELIIYRHLLYSNLRTIKLYDRNYEKRKNIWHTSNISKILM